MQKIFKVKRALGPHLSVILQLQKEGKNMRHLCDYFKDEFSWHFSDSSLSRAIAELTNPRSKKRRPVKKLLNIKPRSEPNGEIIHSDGKAPSMENKRALVKTPKLAAAHAYLGVIRRLRWSGRSFQDISSHLEQVFGVVIPPRELHLAFIETNSLRPKKTFIVSKPQGQKISIVRHAETIHRLLGDGFNVKAIAGWMKEEYGIDIPERSLRDFLRRQKRHQSPDSADIVYGAPVQEMEGIVYEPYQLGIGFLKKKKRVS